MTPGRYNSLLLMPCSLARNAGSFSVPETGVKKRGRNPITHGSATGFRPRKQAPDSGPKTRPTYETLFASSSTHQQNLKHVPRYTEDASCINIHTCTVTREPPAATKQTHASLHANQLLQYRRTTHTVTRVPTTATTQTHTPLHTSQLLQHHRHVHRCTRANYCNNTDTRIVTREPTTATHQTHG